MRFDGHRYVDCRWCGGRGCLQCEGEFNKAYERAFPDGPKPIATFKLDTPEGTERARRAIGVEALQKAFGPDGGGMSEFMANLERDGAGQ
jgi:hypothetical protein